MDKYADVHVYLISFGYYSAIEKNKIIREKYDKIISVRYKASYLNK